MPSDDLVLLLGASSYGMRALEALGIDFVLVHDREDDPNAVEASKVNSRIGASSDIGSIADVDAIDSVHRSQCEKGRTPTALLSFAERGQYPTAVLSDRYGLSATPGLEAVRATSDKALMRTTLSSTPYAWPHVAGSARTVVESLRKDLTPRQPWFIKPVSGSASRDVRIVKTQADVDGWQREHRDDGALWIAEHAAGGNEYSVEAVTFGPGAHRVLGVTEKRVQEGTFVESGHRFPADLSDGDTAALADFTCSILTALGVHCGASHTEVKLTRDHGPVLVETHTRPGGDEIPELVRLVTGVDQYQLAISSLLHRTPASASARTVDEASIVFVVPTTTGSFAGLTWPTYGTHTTAHQTALPGSHIRGLNSSSDRLGWVMSTHAGSPDGSSWYEASRVAARATVNMDPPTSHTAIDMELEQ